MVKKFLVSKNSLILEYLRSEKREGATEFIIQLNQPHFPPDTTRSGQRIGEH